MKPVRFAKRSISGPVAVCILLATASAGCFSPGPASGPVSGVVRASTRKANRTQPLEITATYTPKDRLPVVGGGEVVQWDVVYHFRNLMPMPIRLSFPPIGVYRFGTVQFAKNGAVHSFCEPQQIIEFAPGETKTFRDQFTGTGMRQSREWVFGPPPDEPLPENVVVGSVFEQPK